MDCKIVIEKCTKTHIMTGIKKCTEINTNTDIKTDTKKVIKTHIETVTTHTVKNIETSIKTSLEIEAIGLEKDIIQATLEGMTVAVVGPKQFQVQIQKADIILELVQLQTEFKHFATDCPNSQESAMEQ